MGNFKPWIRTNNKDSVGQMVKKRDMVTTTRPRRCRVHTSSTADIYKTQRVRAVRNSFVFIGVF